MVQRKMKSGKDSFSPLPHSSTFFSKEYCLVVLWKNLVEGTHGGRIMINLRFADYMDARTEKPALETLVELHMQKFEISESAYGNPEREIKVKLSYKFQIPIEQLSQMVYQDRRTSQEATDKAETNIERKQHIS